MASVYDVAKYILQKSGSMSALKLQKLCYYSQAWSIAWTEKPLFEQEFEAWKNGPVCKELFNEHRGMFIVNQDNLNFGNSGNLDSDQQDTINHVLTFYGHRDPYDLREQTHKEEPWKKAREGLREDELSNNIITKESMGEYYGNL